MNIKQIKYSRDNLGYLVYSGSIGIAIDAGGVEETLKFARDNCIEIIYVCNTHSHPDHTSGNEQLLEKTSASFIDCTQIRSDTSLQIGEETLDIWPTPGHTADCITFRADRFIVTGDTLFNGTVGNCFSGDFDAFFDSLKRLVSLPGDTLIYAGHDYVYDSMKMAAIIEKHNPDIEKYLSLYNPDLVVSCLADELKVNPYIRFDAPEMIENLNQRKMPAGSSAERFRSIMEIY